MTTTAKKTTTKTAVKAKATPIPNLPKIPFAFEVFDAASKQRTKAKKIEVLQRYAHDSIMALLIWNFDETAISLLPLVMFHMVTLERIIVSRVLYLIRLMMQLVRCLRWVQFVRFSRPRKGIYS